MIEPLARYQFISWLRRGFAAEPTRVDGTAGTSPRIDVALDVRFNADDALSGSVTVPMMGPGEVTDFDPRCVVRMWPRPGVMDAESNYFVLAEFDQANIPWQITPARATPGGRLTPWVSLVVVADDEVGKMTPGRQGAFASIELKDAAVLPRHSQLWAWAHAQYSGADAMDETKAQALMAQTSPQLIARLLCPRRLTPQTAYTAIIVPTFLRGVMRGLGQDVPDAVDALEPAWVDNASGPITLPIYVQWRFGTGISGDFETLARLLKKFEAPASVGIRDMDASAPSAGMPAAAAAPLGLRGMLEALGTEDRPVPWPDAQGNAWLAKLKALLNLPAERLRTENSARTVAPPLYGQWPAAADRCAAGEADATPAWFNALNVDPRLRVGAGLGTQVVQAQQDALMASAWEQVDRVRHLNEELRQAQLAREISLRLFERHMKKADPEALLALTAPLHGRVKASPTTVRSVLARSALPEGVFEGAFRRIARPRGPIARRPARAGARGTGGLFSRINEGTLSAAPPPEPPSDMASPGRSGAGLAPTGSTAASAARRGGVARALRLLALVLLAIAAIVGLATLAGLVSLGFAGLAGAVTALVGSFAYAFSRTSADLALRVALRDGTLSGAALRSAPVSADFAPLPAPLTGVPSALPTVTMAGAAAPVERIAEFRDAAAQLFERIAPPTAAIRTAVRVDLPALSRTLGKRLEPRATFAAAYRRRFELSTKVHWRPEDPIEPINAAPEFPQPMYKELCKLSPDWLLPGLSAIPKNTVTLLKTNQAMIEAYMIGLNHEMGRELLWREYPTEQRGTFFRQFWDVRGVVPPPGHTLDPEKFKDITPIHLWPKGSSLGTHRPAVAASGGEYLVLLIRGDLLNRYPNTVVYAARAKWLENGLRDIDDPALEDSAQVVADKQRWPVFRGRIDPDASFFGFALTKQEARGSADPADGLPGFYFVLQEHSSEPRFGLDDPDQATIGQPVVGSNWNNLSWGSLAADAAALDALVTIDLDADLPDTTQIKSTVTKKWHANAGLGETGSRASDLAHITFQRPMRVGIHGEDMVPDA